MLDGAYESICSKSTRRIGRRAGRSALGARAACRVGAWVAAAGGGPRTALCSLGRCSLLAPASSPPPRPASTLCQLNGKQQGIMSLGSYAVVGAASAALVAVTSSTSSPSALPSELNKLVSRLASRFHSLEAAELQQLTAALCVLVMLRTVYRRLTAPPAFRAEAVGEARTAPASEKETIAALPGIVEGLRASFRSEKTLAYGWRIQQLRGLQKMLAENGDEIFAACKADCGKSQAEWFFESKSIAGDLDIAISQLSEWMKPTCRQTPFWMQPARSYVTHEPLGTVLIVSPWNYPIALALQVGATPAAAAATRASHTHHVPVTTWCCL
eukprot:COSAG01_NODE_2989_length_6747_cov_6.669073_2_plen_328_part_00